MKNLAIVVLLLLISTSAYANCAIEKKDEFDKLNEKLKEFDMDLALEAKRAFGMISAYEAFDDKSPRCTHIDNLLDNMRDSIDTLTP